MVAIPVVLALTTRASICRACSGQAVQSVQVAGMILAVHEDIGADLKLGKHAERCVDVVRPSACAGHDRR